MKESGLKTKAAIYFIGISTIANQFLIYNYYDIVTLRIDTDFFTFLVLLISIPQILITPFTPNIMKKLSAKTITVIQYAIQIPMLIIFPIIFTLDSLEKTTTLKVLFAGIALISTCALSIFLGASFFWASLYGGIEVTLVATGMCTGGAVTPLIFIFLENCTTIEKTSVEYLVICSSYLAVYHLLAIFSFVYLYRKSLAEKVKDALSSDNTTSVGRDVYISVIKQKWAWLLMSFMLFFLLFVPFPWQIYFGLDRDDNVLDGNIMAAVFGFSELLSRISYMKAEKFLNKIYNKKTIPYIFVLFIILCSLPITFYCLKGSSPSFLKFSKTLGYEALLVVIWILIATNLGLMGNVTTVCICSGLETDDEASIACSYQPMVNVLGIFSGALVAHILKKVTAES